MTEVCAEPPGPAEAVQAGSYRAPDLLLLEAFKRGLAAVSPESVLPPALPPPPPGRTVVVGAGKASASMARALERHWAGALSGMVVVPPGYGLPCRFLQVIEAAHPVPDRAGMLAAREMMDRVAGLNEDDLVIGLFSGGGSALLPLARGSVSLEDKRTIIGELLRAGADIAEINCLRKHLSAIKGGRLARAAAPAAFANILISDVAGDDPSLIASGPAVPDRSTLAQARSVVEKYHLNVSEAVRAHLADEKNETPKPDDPCFSRVSATIVASARMLLEGAAHFLRTQGLQPYIISDRTQGESRQVAQVHADLARQVLRKGQPLAPPCVLLSGGETTVTIRGEGKGGPNMEYLLALLVALGDSSSFAAIACDSDGSDGSTGVAGAIMRPDSAARACAAGLDTRRALEGNDSESFFAALDDLVVTGPTFNNVNDFRALFVSDRRRPMHRLHSRSSSRG